MTTPARRPQWTTRPARTRGREKYLGAVVGEDWYPNVNENLVCAFITSLGDGSWRVAAWGDDDFGLEKDGLTEAEALVLFDSMPDPLSQAWCEQRGFRQG